MAQKVRFDRLTSSSNESCCIKLCGPVLLYQLECVLICHKILFFVWKTVQIDSSRHSIATSLHDDKANYFPQAYTYLQFSYLHHVRWQLVLCNLVRNSISYKTVFFHMSHIDNRKSISNSDYFSFYFIKI